MDTQQDMLYRAFLLNDASVDPDPLTGSLRSGITGSVVDTFDISDVDLVQFMEKKAQKDGMDAGDVFQGSRRIRMAGTLYAKTRPELFDMWDDFLATTSAVLAQRESPVDKGYLPLYFTKATARSADYPDLLIPLKVFVLPRSRQVIAQRDQLGGKITDALAVPWQASFVAKDPVIYSADPVEVALSGSTGEQTWRNRGNYISSFNLLAQVGSSAGSIAITVGGTVMTITVPASTGNRIIRYKGADRYLTVEENSQELPRYDLLNTGTLKAHPVVPPGTSTYTITFTSVTPAAGSKAFFYEAYA